MLSSKLDHAKAKYHVIERKTKKRKGECDLRSCFMLQGERNEDLKRKIEQGEFSFHILISKTKLIEH